MRGMKRTFTASMLLPATILVASALAQAPSQPDAQQPTPWPVMLGMRVAGVQEKIPLQDRVVLVPDEATFIDEISKWTLQGRWPAPTLSSSNMPMLTGCWPRPRKPFDAAWLQGFGAMTWPW